jgi:hypothetical protein|tara:strand:- start:1655 stop:2083 length:429 start_codon:yes stop_codon:yes gene_type:complete
MKKLFVILLVLLNSCGFLFYNYRTKMKIVYSIPLNSPLVYSAEEVGEFIFKLGEKEDFYDYFSSNNFDSIYFYGPDYHSLNFKLLEEIGSLKITLDYFGYNGNRSKPPRAEFLKMISDSLQIKFQAQENIKYILSNEKQKNK